MKYLIKPSPLRGGAPKGWRGLATFRGLMGLRGSETPLPQASPLRGGNTLVSEVAYSLTRGCNPLHIGFALIVCLIFSFATSQQYWTLQTLAVPDTTVAYSLQTQLAAQGFDTYVESTYKNDQYYLRVRLGCFSNKDVAQEFADHVSAVTAREMVVLPFTNGSSPQICVQNDLGFLTTNLAGYWGLQEQRGAFVTFWVYVANQYAYMTFNSHDWLIYQRPEEMAAAQPSYYQQPTYTTQQFRQSERLGLPCVEVMLPSGQTIVLTTGRLVWQFGNSAVIQNGDGVYSYTLEPSG